MAYPLLSISPSQLEFLFESERELKSTLNLRNVNEGVRVAFKIKTTNSERFVVCPPSGIIEPGTSRLVKVYMKAQQEFDDELRLCKDRFLVQSIVVGHTLMEHHISSNLFRSGQRQEAKLKVMVAAPLAHSTVLENEIRSIAMREGVEGHRAVVRKFSELLLARGIISQAQVVLAFGTVGEIFQGLQDAYKATTAERERTFQQFLGDRGASETAVQPVTHTSTTSDSDRSSARSLNVQQKPTADSVTLYPQASSILAANSGKWSHASGHGKPAKTDERRHSAHTASPTAPTTPTAELQEKESVGYGSDTGLTPADLNSEGSGGRPGHTAKRFNSDALQLLFHHSNGRQEEEKAEVNSSSSPLSQPDGIMSHLDFRQRGSVGSDTELAFESSQPTPGRTRGVGRKSSGSRRTIGELISEAQTDEKAEPLVAPEPERRDNYTSPGHIALLTGVYSSSAKEDGSEDEASTPESRPQRENRLHNPSSSTEKREFSQDTGPKPSVSAFSPQHAPLHSREIQPEPEIVPDAETEILSDRSDRPLSGRENRASREGVKDTLGRLNPVTSIDRLATPAIRKSKPAANNTADDAQSNGSPREDGSPVQPLSSWRATEEQYESPSMDLGELPNTDKDGSAGRLKLHNSNSSGSGSLGIAIPSGNTRKMAHLFGRGK